MSESAFLFPKTKKKPKKRKSIKKQFTQTSDLRQFARGQECTLRLEGVCNHDPETTVLAHIVRKGHSTMGGKPHDLSAVHACSACHDVIDGRNNVCFFNDGLELAKFNAILETIDRAVNAGLVEF